MLDFWDYGLVSHPKIGKTVACIIGVWNGLPQASASLLASISYGVSNHLTRLTAQDDPDPRLVRLFQYK